MEIVVSEISDREITAELNNQKAPCDNCGIALNKSELLTDMDNDGNTITLCPNCK